MDISRRKLLQLGLLHAGMGALPLRADTLKRVERRTGPSILQGATDDSKTQFSVVHAANKNYNFKVRSMSGQIWTPDQVVKHSLKGQDRVIRKVYFSGLHLNELFILSLFDAKTGALVEEREFKMLDIGKRRLRFALCSCMDEFEHKPEIWSDLVTQELDLIFFVGDSVYCDYGSKDGVGAAHLWRRFAESRATLEIYFSKRLIPIVATWDDHDFGKNDCGRDYPFAKESLINFFQFFAMDPSYCSALERGPGASSRVTIGEQQFILMDDRTWRVAGASRERYAHWGQLQEEWLLARVAQHEGMTWIMNGSQVFPQMIFKQSFSGEHPVQFNAVKQALSRMDRRVAFVSGDVHFSEISQLEGDLFGYQTYELTSSSIHSEKFPGLPDIIPNARRIAATGEHNYLLVDSEPFGKGCRFLVESRSAGQKLNFSLQLTV